MERNPGAEDDGHGEDDPRRAEGGHEEHGRDGLRKDERDDGAAPVPLDEDAAWEQIVAAYGDHPKAEGMASADSGGDARTGTAARPAPGPRPEGESEGDDGATPVRSFTVYSAGSGPRDWSLPASDDEPGGTPEEDDEGHFVPPEPPPLPQADTTGKFAWLAVLGGPLLLIFTVLFQQELTWWIATLGIGGFLGGFGTLVARMRDGRDEDDWDDPGRGAVV
ncbi:hypothetical protein [Streptomyces sp. WMMB 322]|uniref:hypothetical protein n=1 Tax=Streptomyces sp. WMMB 322 TaxID=1286821 RepID=UPI000823AD50|nr:hypothetical protein [Streptomyces sp. WMMB 322]SCK24852.1 hypothetical protein H180DRAFT_01893 [Streptomyces sp. WMMB 322]